MTAAPAWITALFTVGQFYALAALLPMLVSERKPSAVSALMVVVPQPLYVAAYLTLGMPGAAALASASGVVWAALLAQSARSRRRASCRGFVVHHGVPAHACLHVEFQ